MLTALEMALIDFERWWWKLPGPKHRDLQVAFGFDAAEYYERLRYLIDEPSALAYDPLTILRLRRMVARTEVWRDRRAGGY